MGFRSCPFKQISNFKLLRSQNDRPGLQPIACKSFAMGGLQIVTESYDRLYHNRPFGF